jgi:hypothetical protein
MEQAGIRRGETMTHAKKEPPRCGHSISGAAKAERNQADSIITIRKGVSKNEQL